MPRLPRTELHALCAALLTAAGLAPDRADAAAEAAVYADTRGIGTHGLHALVTMYVPWVRSGRVDAAAETAVVSRKGATAVIDGGDGLGPVVMTEAADLAGALAAENGVGLVAVNRSTHFGAAGYYAHRLARRGMVGIAMTNCGEQGVIPPLGGSRRLMGTNPLAAAVPAGPAPTFVLDMSTTVVATGKVNQARRDGAAVPQGWLLDTHGNDVTDPGAYGEGTADVPWLGGRLATGAAKGYGLGLLVDLLCGPLAGAGFGPRREALEADGPSEDRDVGHVCIAVDPAFLGDRDRIADRSAELLQTVADSPTAAWADRVTYPGAPEAANAEAAERDGVPIAGKTAAAAAELAAELGVAVPPAFAERTTR